jgi:hypothetical protein
MVLMISAGKTRFMTRFSALNFENIVLVLVLVLVLETADKSRTRKRTRTNRILDFQAPRIGATRPSCGYMPII